MQHAAGADFPKLLRAFTNLQTVSKHTLPKFDHSQSGGNRNQGFQCSQRTFLERRLFSFSSSTALEAFSCSAVCFISSSCFCSRWFSNSRRRIFVLDVSFSWSDRELVSPNKKKKMMTPTNYSLSSSHTLVDFWKQEWRSIELTRKCCCAKGGGVHSAALNSPPPEAPLWYGVCGGRIGRMHAQTASDSVRNTLASRKRPDVWTKRPITSQPLHP